MLLHSSSAVINAWDYPLFPLVHDRIRLLPFQYEHIDELVELGREACIWQFFPINCAAADRHRQLLEESLEQQEMGEHLPFVIELPAQNRLIGYTRYFNLAPQHAKLEIGSWLHPEAWGTGINFESKYLLLNHAFEEMMVQRVQFKADETNLRSRAALLKIGASYEGILRHDMILESGRVRNSAYYSILEHEWPMVKLRLETFVRQQ
jgi:N-acetyltransferase